MTFKRLMTLILLVGIMLTGITPLLAQESSFDINPYMESYFASLADYGFGGVGAADLSTELLEADLFLLDVRNASELEELGFIEGAVNVPVRALAQHLDMLPADLDTPIVIYCAKGTRGNIAAATLRIMGYSDVRNLAGGFGAWAEAGNPVATEMVEVEAAGPAEFDPELVAFVDDYLTNVLPEGWGQIGVEDYAIEMLETPSFLLDVRTQGEWDGDGYIDGATLVPIVDLFANLDAVPMDEPIVAQCKGGWRGTLAMVPLQMLGYETRNLAGGLNAWKVAELPVEGAMVEEAQAEFDIAPYMESYFASLADFGFGGIGNSDLAVELLDNPDLFLLDVREQGEWDEQGYIEGATLVPVRSLAQHLDLLPADLDEPIVVYCAAGTRGNIVAATMRIMGYTNVRNLSGGFRGWVADENPIATEAVEFEAVGPADFDPALVAFVDDYLTNVLPQGWGQIGVEDYAAEMLETPSFLLDVRTQGEWDGDGYIDGATLVPIVDLFANLDVVPMDEPIVAQCKGGWRGNLAMVPLQMLGYETRNLAGGLNGWKAAELPVEGGMVEAEAEAATAVVEVVLPEGMALAAEMVAPVSFTSVETIAGLAGFGTMAEADFAAAMDDAFVLDVREVGEYEEGFIPGAVNVPLREMPATLNVLPADMDAPILVYCKAGYRGAVAALGLDMLGYTNVMNLRGGIGAWTGELASEAPTAGGEFPAVEADLWTAVNDYFVALPAGWGIISPDDLALQMTEEEIFIVDVREAAEYEGGHIEGAVNWPTRTFTQYIEDGPDAMDAAIVVYGSGGHRTALAQHALSMAGYENVLGMAAGSGGWGNAGYELVTE